LAPGRPEHFGAFGARNWQWACDANDPQTTMFLPAMKKSRGDYRLKVNERDGTHHENLRHNPAERLRTDSVGNLSLYENAVDTARYSFES